MRDVLCDVLMEEGYYVAPAGNGKELLDVLAELGAGDVGPDLIVLDHRMPVLDGPASSRRTVVGRGRTG